MLLTWHKNNNFPNLQLDLDCQLEEKDIYKKKLQYIYTKYIVIVTGTKNYKNRI